MNASWSMVFGALLAGTVGGFMIPVRPEIRDVPALTASKATEATKKPAADKTASTPTTAKAENASDARKIPLTEATSKSAEPNAQAESNRQTDANSCAKETWPYRSPNCLDRTAKVAPADTVVPARPVDPAVSLRDDQKTETASKPEINTAKPETAKSQQKVVSTPPAREERSERPAPQPEQASTRPADEPRAQAANERQERSTNKPRRSTRRVNRDPVDLDDGIPTRIYLRGPDGRLYLAPEYRPSGRTVYYMR
ncbi:MAG TPA: hypothetical protein VFY21_00945 [Xanthobacteraceae bacterium]|nr:hypothetical protein [Xanthobacteraceae bacterium]